MVQRFALPWPRSLQGQLMLSIGLALLLAQGLSAALRWRAQEDRREAAAVHVAAMRLVSPDHDAAIDPPLPGLPGHGAAGRAHRMRGARIDFSSTSPIRAGEVRLTEAEDELQRTLRDQLEFSEVIVVRRATQTDPRAIELVNRRAQRLARIGKPLPPTVLLATIHTSDPQGWLTVRVPEPQLDRSFIIGLVTQTLLIFALLTGATWLIVRKITKPLAALTSRIERFAAKQDAAGPLEPRGPDDLRRLIGAHNAMEARLSAMLDEKDVMLGAIGHDLKTPLAALRVRIESVEDEAERGKMARTIEDITRSLDDILSLARVGRPSDPLEPADLGALVAQVAEEFEDMGEPVTFIPAAGRIVLPLRATWLRRAVRNLTVNALRYGHTARIGLTREADRAVISIADDGPGIPPGQLAAMLEPFTRGDPSRNSETGGAGLGLTLARAIADQHGGTLRLINRTAPGGQVTGLTASLSLPLI